jgi:hypothetical protein
MKKIFFFLLISISFAAKAQKNLPEYDNEQYGFEIKPANLYMEADKNLCELKEIINVNVRMMIADKENAVPYIFNYKFKDPTEAPWKNPEFKIVSGGAKIGITDGGTAQIIMPATMPKEKAVVVQATLNPVTKEYSQVQVFTTIYLEDNDNVFYFNCPYLKINNEKYVVKYNGGALAPSDAAAKNAAGTKNPAMQQKIKEYTMKAATADVTTTQFGFDLSAITSNAKAIYAKDEDVTTITINGDNIEMVNGVKSTAKRMFLVVLSFPGKKAGSFKIRSDKKITATITLPQIQPGYACTCAEDPKDPDHIPPTCMGGSITITNYDEKTKLIEGTVVAYLESADGTVTPPRIFYSTLNGKFKIPLAN